MNPNTSYTSQTSNMNEVKVKDGLIIWINSNHHFTNVSAVQCFLADKVHYKNEISEI